MTRWTVSNEWSLTTWVQDGRQSIYQYFCMLSYPRVRPWVFGMVIGGLMSWLTAVKLWKQGRTLFSGNPWNFGTTFANLYTLAHSWRCWCTFLGAPISRFTCTNEYYLIDQAIQINESRQWTIHHWIWVGRSLQRRQWLHGEAALFIIGGIDE